MLYDIVYLKHIHQLHSKNRSLLCVDFIVDHIETLRINALLYPSVSSSYKSFISIILIYYIICYNFLIFPALLTDDVRISLWPDVRCTFSLYSSIKFSSVTVVLFLVYYYT